MNSTYTQKCTKCCTLNCSRFAVDGAYTCAFSAVSCPPQYSVPVVKYDRNGFRPRLRQLIFTQEAAYLIEEAKIKQRINYTSLKGNTCQI